MSPFGMSVVTAIRRALRYHHQNLSRDELPLWRHGRAWALGLGWEWHCFHDSRLLSFEIGWRRFAIHLRWFSLAIQPRDGGRGGAWDLSWHDGACWFSTPWERPSVRWSPVETLLGRWKHSVERRPLGLVYIPLPEGCYEAQATEERRTWRRRLGFTKRRTDVSLDICGGIPFSGKGENSWDCGDDGLFGCGGDTVEDAIANAVRSVLRSRRRHGHDSKGTGRIPRVVLNAADPAAGGAS